VYFAPLEEQSSRMFEFVFKMFSEGSAALPRRGMGAVAKKLADKAAKAGIDVRLGSAVTGITQNDDGSYLLDVLDRGEDNDDKKKKKKTTIQAKSVVVATDSECAQKLISTLENYENVAELPKQPQLSVGCLYYAFDGPAPVNEPILILNGVGETRGTPENPVNNVCFPSVVNEGYAPAGKQLCSVTVLEDAMRFYEGSEQDLDAVVRQQLSSWFPTFKDDILERWELKRIYFIPNAQPSQKYGPFPANVNRVRRCTQFKGVDLPDGLFVCGDYMATASYNGAIESGIKAGAEAAKVSSRRR